MQSPQPPVTQTSNYPRPNLDDERPHLRRVAAAQRNVIFCVLGQIAVLAIEMLGVNTSIMAVVCVALALALALTVFMIVSVVRLAGVLGLSPVLYVICMFVPCLSLIVLLVLSGMATARLQQSGVKVGLLGADPNSI